jgi:hypothetical protein
MYKKMITEGVVKQFEIQAPNGPAISKVDKDGFHFLAQNISSRTWGSVKSSNKSTVALPVGNELPLVVCFSYDQAVCPQAQFLRAKVAASLADPRPNVEHAQLMDDARALLQAKRHQRATEPP